MPTASTSSSPAAERLIRIPLGRLHAHPANANEMAEPMLAKLGQNIVTTGGYQPLTVRDHPDIPGDFQILNGTHRAKVLGQQGATDALCYLWPCDDTTALLLVASLNRLAGEDVPVRRAELLAELQQLLPADELAQLLPEDAGQIGETLALLELDGEALLADLTRAAADHAASGPRVVSFALSPEDERSVEAAVAGAMHQLEGTNRRGRALALVARAYLERGDA